MTTIRVSYPDPRERSLRTTFAAAVSSWGADARLLPGTVAPGARDDLVEFAITTNAAAGTVGLSRSPHRSEGCRILQATVPFGAAGLLIDSQVGLVARLQRRDAAIAEAGCDVDDPPAWAFTCEPFTPILLAARGIDPLEAITPRGPHRRWVRTEDGHERPLGARIGVGRVIRRADRIGMIARLDPAGATRGPVDGSIVYDDLSHELPVLSVHGVPMPADVADTMAGVDLADFMSMTGLAHGVVAIARATVRRDPLASTDVLDLHLERGRTALEPVPEGVRDDWSRSGG